MFKLPVVLFQFTENSKITVTYYFLDMVVDALQKIVDIFDVDDLVYSDVGVRCQYWPVHYVSFGIFTSLRKFHPLRCSLVKSTKDIFH